MESLMMDQANAMHAVQYHTYQSVTVPNFFQQRYLFSVPNFSSTASGTYVRYLIFPVPVLFFEKWKIPDTT